MGNRPAVKTQSKMSQLDSNGTSPPKKQILLNAFVMTTPGHLSSGYWNDPRNKTADYNKLSFWTNLARTLDDAGFHSMFIADTLGAYDIYKGPGNVNPSLKSGAQFPVNDPLYAVPAMAAATKRLVFGVTASTTYDAPYALARRFSTVDHLTEGRVAWNIVTSYLDSAARNFGLNTQVEHDERYRIAEEYMEVVYKLWEGSWADDAAVRDYENGVFATAGKVHDINHKGKYFTVPGPHICEPSPQRTPFLFQAGTSKAGIEFGAKHAEAIFLGGQTAEKVRGSVDSLRAAAKSHGRDPSHIKMIAGVCIIIDETDEKARKKRDDFLAKGDREGALALFGGWTGIGLSTYTDDEDFRFAGATAVQSLINRWAETVPGSEGLPWTKARIADYLLLGGVMPKSIGGPKTVVDGLERWIEEGDVDGFNLAHVVNPGSFEDMIEFLLPELKRRALFTPHAARDGATTREVFFGQPRVFEDHPAYQYRWRE